jgi:hypothetical protein
LSKEKQKKQNNFVKEMQEMVSLGLWPRSIPNPEPQMLERIQRLDNEILKGLYELHLPEVNSEAVLKRVEDEYFQLSLKKREKRTEDRNLKKISKSKEWETFRKNHFPHLGKQVSTWLNNKEEDKQKLVSMDLPSIPSASALSEFLDIKIPQIKWLAYHRESSRVYHYQDFTIQKASSGKRYISKPLSRMHRAQKVIKEQILDKLRWKEEVFGFIKGKSIFNNANFHRSPNLLINIDVKDFFQSIPYYQVRSVFRKLGYSGEIASVLALLTTKQTANRVEINDQVFYSFSKNRYLPTGSCTSPALSNLVFMRIDTQLKKRSKKVGFSYSRYADDLTFSTKEKKPKIKTLLYIAKKTLELHGFMANPTKTKVLGKCNSQNITGLIVNSGQPKIPRAWRRNLRAAIHQFGSITNVELKQEEYIKLLGSLNYLKLTHPQHAKKYLNLVEKNL